MDAKARTPLHVGLDFEAMDNLRETQLVSGIFGLFKGAFDLIDARYEADIARSEAAITADISEERYHKDFRAYEVSQVCKAGEYAEMGFLLGLFAAQRPEWLLLLGHEPCFSVELPEVIPGMEGHLSDFEAARAAFQAGQQYEESRILRSAAKGV